MASLLLVLLTPAGCSGAGGGPLEGGGKPGKLLVIAVDGITWDLIRPFMRSGHMPNFERMRMQGASGRLDSLVPITSPIIFTTIATGRTPEDHGIRGFVKNQEDGGQAHYTSEDRRVKAIWNILSDRDRSVDVVGWFTSWPADVVNGAFISDRSESVIDGGSHPSDLEPMILSTNEALPAERVREAVQGFYGPAIDFDTVPVGDARVYRRIEESVEHYYRVDRLRLEWTLELMRRGQSDFTAVFFKGTDPVQHLTWTFMDPEPFREYFTPPPEGVQRYGNVIRSYYEFIDESVGRLVEAASPDTDVIILSDHGAGPATAMLARHVNPVLARLGWLETDEEGRADIDRSLLIDPTPQGREGGVERRLVVNRHLIVERSADAEGRGKIVADVAATLESARTTDGELLFTAVRVSGGEGNAADGLPRYSVDVTVNKEFQSIVKTDSGTEVTGQYVVSGETHPLTDLVSIRWERSGGHRMNGIIMLAGPRIGEQVRIKKASVYDLMPTMLRLLGLPQAGDMQGRILDEAILTANVPPSGPTVETYEDGRIVGKVGAPDMPEIEEELEKRLRAIGYIQ